MNNIHFKKCFSVLIKTLKSIFKYALLVILFSRPALRSAAKKKKKMDDDYYEYLQIIHKINNNE
jgi:hypothetical protein